MFLDIFGHIIAAAWCAASTAVIWGCPPPLPHDTYAVPLHRLALVWYPLVQHWYVSPVDKDRGCAVPDDDEHGWQPNIAGQHAGCRSRTSAAADTTYIIVDETENGSIICMDRVALVVAAGGVGCQGGAFQRGLEERLPTAVLASTI